MSIEDMGRQERIVRLRIAIEQMATRLGDAGYEHASAIHFWLNAAGTQKEAEREAEVDKWGRARLRRGRAFARLVDALARLAEQAPAPQPEPAPAPRRRTAPRPAAGPVIGTAREVAIAMIEAPTEGHAQNIAQQLGQAGVTQVARALGVTIPRGLLEDRWRQLAHAAIGAAIKHATLRHQDDAAAIAADVEAHRQRRIAELRGESA